MSRCGRLRAQHMPDRGSASSAAQIRIVRSPVGITPFGLIVAGTEQSWPRDSGAEGELQSIQIWYHPAMAAESGATHGVRFRDQHPQHVLLAMHVECVEGAGVEFTARCLVAMLHGHRDLYAVKCPMTW